MSLLCFEIFAFFSLSPIFLNLLLLRPPAQAHFQTLHTNAVDCGPNCPLLQEYLDGHVVEMNNWMKAFEELKKADEKRRANICARIDAKVPNRSFNFSTFYEMNLLASFFKRYQILNHHRGLSSCE